MFENPTPMEHKDLPKTHIDDDTLGFEPFVKKVAAGIKGYSQPDCFVISIEGQWGIGKTTFMNLVKNEIKDDVVILHFNPWLLTDIESLVVTFFSELMKTVNRIDFDAKLKEEILKDMKKFLVGLSYLLPESISLGISGTKAKYNIRGTIDKISAEKKLSLDEQKSKINEYLSEIYRKTGKKILIVIDDIDRLMDKETELIFRLIKGIADFNNIIYVLLFDRDIVSKSLVHFKSEDGSKYLDKVIQYPLVVPKPYSGRIVEMLRSKFDSYLTILGESYKYSFNQDSWNALYPVLNKYIKTVRDVNKIFATVSFEFESICEDVDFVDFLIITLIRLHAHNLYQFIKENPEYFRYSGKYELLGYSDMSKTEVQDKLKVLIRERVVEFDDYYALLEIMFPLFDKYDPRDIRNDHVKKSISDSYYFDRYFSMTVSSDKLSHVEHSELVQLLVTNPEEFVRDIFELGDSKINQFVSILKSRGIEDFIKVKLVNNLMLILNELDKRDFRTDNSFCDNSPYEGLWIGFISNLIGQLEDPLSTFELFKNEDIGIQYRCHLVMYVIKDYKDKNINTYDEILEICKNDILNKIESMDIDKFLSFNFVDILSFCFSWNNLDNSKLKTPFEEALFESQESFFLILEKYIYKQVSMPRKDYPYSISKSALGVMIDLEIVQNYIDKLEIETLSDENKRLLNYWNNDDKW